MVEAGSSGSGGPVAVVAGMVDPCAARGGAGRPGLRGRTGRYRPRTTAHDCLWWSGMKCRRAGDTVGRGGPDRPLRAVSPVTACVRHCLRIAAWAGHPRPRCPPRGGVRSLTVTLRTQGTPRALQRNPIGQPHPLSPSQSRSNQVERHCAWVGYGHMAGLLRIRVVSRCW